MPCKKKDNPGKEEEKEELPDEERYSYHARAVTPLEALYFGYYIE